MTKAVMRKLAGSFGDLMKKEDEKLSVPKQPAEQIVPKTPSGSWVKIKLEDNPKGKYQPPYDPRGWLYPWIWDASTKGYKWNWGSQINAENVASKRIKNSKA